MYKIIGADGKEYGPITVEVLRQWIAEGRANNQTKVLPEGATEWKMVGDVPELAARPESAPTSAPATPAILTAPQTISMPAKPRNNSLAVAGLVLGILSVTLGLCCCYGLPFSVPGLICSLMGLNQIKTDSAGQQGKNLAIAGLVLSALGILLGLALLGLVVAFGTPDMLRRFQKL